MDLPDEKDMLSTTMDPDKQKLDAFFGGDLDGICLLILLSLFKILTTRLKLMSEFIYFVFE